MALPEERYRKIIDFLSEYHRDFVNSRTLKSQNSQNTITEIRNTLDNQCEDLINFFRWRTMPKNLDDSKFEKLIKSIEPLLNNSDTEMSTIIVYWCNKIFREYPFNLSPEHINNLYKNSQLKSEDVMSS